MPTSVAAPVCLLPREQARLTWSEVSAGVERKLFARADDTGALSGMLRFAPGAAAPVEREHVWRETYVLDGALVADDGRTYGAGAFTCRAPGEHHAWIAGPDGCLALEVEDVTPGLSKPSVSYTGEDVAAMPWRPMEGRDAGFWEKVFVLGPCGSKTHLVRIEPLGEEPNRFRAEAHEHAEEMLAVEGGYWSGSDLHPAGTYTCNPPGTVHGPFTFDQPFLCLEIKNQVRP